MRCPTLCGAAPPYSLEVRFQTVWGGAAPNIPRSRIFQGNGPVPPSFPWRYILCAFSMLNCPHPLPLLNYPCIHKIILLLCWLVVSSLCTQYSQVYCNRVLSALASTCLTVVGLYTRNGFVTTTSKKYINLRKVNITWVCTRGLVQLSLLTLSA